MVKTKGETTFEYHLMPGEIAKMFGVNFEASTSLLADGSVVLRLECDDVREPELRK